MHLIRLAFVAAQGLHAGQTGPPSVAVGAVRLCALYFHLNGRVQGKIRNIQARCVWEQMGGIACARGGGGGSEADIVTSTRRGLSFFFSLLLRRSLLPLGSSHFPPVVCYPAWGGWDGPATRRGDKCCAYAAVVAGASGGSSAAHVQDFLCGWPC